MGWQTVTHTCGHSERYQLYGPHIERQRKAEYLAQEKCPVCREAEHVRDAQQAAEWATTQGLPRLQGSDKQIVWAEQIRRNMVPRMRTCIQDVLGRTPAEYRDQVTQITSDLINQSLSSWWIDHRDDARDPRGLILATLNNNIKED